MLEGTNRKDSLRECLIELNLEFDASFRFYCSHISLLFLLFIYIQICTWCPNDTIEFVRLEYLNEPSVKSIPGEEGIEW